MSTRKQNVVAKKSTTKLKERESSTDRTKTKPAIKKNEKDEVKKTTSRTTKLSTPKVQEVTKPKIVSKSVSNVKKSAPKSPTSKRVVKSQFFPSKQMYSNALKTAGKTVSTEPKISTRKKPKEDFSESSSSSKVERPSTATLRRGSIVNENIAGPDVPKEAVKVPKQLKLSNPITRPAIPKAVANSTPPEDEYDYEDDFDSYASDFEEYESSQNSDHSTDLDIKTGGEITSSSSEENLQETAPKRINSADEERKLDSGNFDLPDGKHKQILDNINETTEKSNLASLSDEGFEESKSSLQFVNFLGAKNKRQREKIHRRKSKRGEELMSMIRLDHRNFTLFEVAPIGYDEYIKSFGNRNSAQVASQTGEDNICEETQTDRVEIANKWTQFPAKFTKINETDNNYLNIYRSELLGVGSDNLDAKLIESDYNEHNLKQFMQNSGQLMLQLLRGRNQAHSKEIEVADRNHPFSDGLIALNNTFLKGRQVVHLSFSDRVQVVTIHGPKAESHGDGNNYELKSIGCIWNLENPAEPEDIFGAFGWVNASCFNRENNKIIFGGMMDGTVTLWDLSEGVPFGELMAIDSEKALPLKPARFTTDVNLQFCSKIVSIYSCRDDNFGERGDRSSHNWIATVQVITLDEFGNLLIWALISTPHPKNQHQSNLSLVRNTVISMSALNPDLVDLVCTDLCINPSDPNHIYVTTNYGYILHCLASGAKTNPKKILSGISSTAKCIDGCPNLAGHFLVGFESGEVCLCSRNVERPLMTLSNPDGDGAEIDVVQWSRNRPRIFYTKDSKNVIHVWDLSHTEMFPTYSIPAKEEIKFIKLSPADEEASRTRSYMAIVTKTEAIYLDILNKDHGKQEAADFSADLKKFTNYVKRL